MTTTPLRRALAIVCVVASGLLIGSHLPLAEASSTSSQCTQTGPVTVGTLTFDDGCVSVRLVDVRH